MFDAIPQIMYASHERGGDFMADVARVRSGKQGIYIHLWWQGERHYISTYMGLVSFRDNEPLAWKAKAAIDAEVDRGVFRPERWKRRAKKLYNVRGYSENWLEKVRPEISTVGKMYGLLSAFFAKG